jgi:Ca2+-binding EF-hand superfamily protein
MSKISDEKKQKLKEIFEKTDKDHNGSLDKAELKSALGELQILGVEYSEGEIDALFDKADANGDGKIQLEEFLHLI